MLIDVRQDLQVQIHGRSGSGLGEERRRQDAAEGGKGRQGQQQGEVEIPLGPQQEGEGGLRRLLEQLAVIDWILDPRRCWEGTSAGAAA